MQRRALAHIFLVGGGRVQRVIEVNMNPDPQAAIRYAWCPDVIEGDSRTANAFCMICMAFMCWECHECHPYEHRNVKQS